MRILIDVDQVLAATLQKLLPVANEMTGRDFKLEQMTEWNLFKSMNLDAETTKALWAIMGSRGWCESLEVLPGAQEGVEELRRLGTVHFVTSPVHSSETWVHERTHWLKKHFNASYDDVTHTSAKHFVAGDFLIDDKVSTLKKWAACHPDGIAIKFLAPGNRLDAWDHEAHNWFDCEVYVTHRKSNDFNREWKL